LEVKLKDLAVDGRILEFGVNLKDLAVDGRILKF